MTQPPTQEQVERIVAGLSRAQRDWFLRGVIRMANPAVVVPRQHPMALTATWKAIQKRGLTEHGRFGQQLTPLGLAVRAHLITKGSDQ